MIFNFGGNLSGSRPPEEKVEVIRVIGNHSGRVLYINKPLISQKKTPTLNLKCVLEYLVCRELFQINFINLEFPENVRSKKESTGK